MKVALVSEWLDPWRGGAETSTWQLVHYLLQRDVELHVFTRSRPSPRPGLCVHTISGAALSRTRRSVTFAHRVEHRLKRDVFDLVHAVSPLRYADIYEPRGGTVAESVERNLALLSSRSAQELKRRANRFNLKQRYALAVEQEIFRAPDGPMVVAISDYVVRQLKRHYAFPDDRVRKIYNGVDPDTVSDADRARHRAAIRQEFDIPSDHLLVLFVAHNFRLKGLRQWMEALRLLVRRGTTSVRSLIVGKGDSERWHRLAGRLRLGDHLQFTGPSERVHEFYHAADVLVHPTYYDPCSRVVLEAVSAGLPCVTTRWDGAAEVIRDGENGFVLEDPGNVGELAQSIVRLQDPSLRQAVAAACRNLDGEIWMSRHASEIFALYEELLLSTPSSRRMT